MRRHALHVFLVLFLFACDDEPAAGEPCGGCLAGGTYKSYDTAPSSEGRASSSSQQIRDVDGSVSTGFPEDVVDHGPITLGPHGLQGRDLAVTYTPPTKPGTYDLTELGAIATTSRMKENVMGTHDVAENGDVTIHFCTGDRSFCSENLLDWEYRASLSGKRTLQGHFRSSRGHRSLTCY